MFRLAPVFKCCRLRLSLSVCNCLFMVAASNQVYVSACICSF
ncbi:hypothetical protein [Methanimicrococcus hongohii]|nr:hypothetical protein [Methanimicrococcus sp. Hf6]